MHRKDTTILLSGVDVFVQIMKMLIQSSNDVDIPQKSIMIKAKNNKEGDWMNKRILSLLLIAVFVVGLLAGCAGAPAQTPTAETATEAIVPETTEPREESDKNGDIIVLYTSDVHCGIAEGFGYGGLTAIRDSLEAQGYTTLLVDNGDAIQGDVIGTVTKGDAILDIMNQARYDVAIPGNHEFDYGMDTFLGLVERAQFPYISCNIRNKDGALIFPPYVMLEAAGKKLAFVGITTPASLTSSTPRNFQNDQGEFIYDFCQDETGQALYDAVQDAVDSARADGADYVLAMAHTGNNASCAPWTYADIIAATQGIDVYLDGHSHDTEQVVMNNKQGKPVIRTACGTKLACVGWVRVPSQGDITANVYTWDNDVSVPSLLGISNATQERVARELAQLDSSLSEVVAHTAVELTISDPQAVDANGRPIRMIRRAETNLGDLCADAYRSQLGTDVALCNGGGIRVSLGSGEITLGDILQVHPFNNEMYVVSATGQQILDALEWACRAVPAESGGFLQVSGMRYEIHTYVESSCTTDENGMFTGVAGEYRVKNVEIGGQPLDPEATYSVASSRYILQDSGDGNTAFAGCNGYAPGKLDNQVLMDHIRSSLGGVIGEAYADPLGDGRIVIVESPA